MQYQLLGFDIRKALNFYTEEAWNLNRRSVFLLREDIEKPLSVDRAVWLPLNKERQMVDGAAVPIMDSSSENVQGEGACIYKHLDEATKYYLDLKTNQQMCGVIIAIEVLNDQMISGEENWYLLSESASPKKLPDSWKFIGYDIADQSLISGLSNCGYSNDEKQALQGLWGNCLNQYGLFGSIDSAIQFCKLTDDRVPEHRPFRVYRISYAPDQVL